MIDHDAIDGSLLPDESAIAAVTLAELAAGPHTTSDEMECSRRQDRLHWASSRWDPLPFDADAAQGPFRTEETMSDLERYLQKREKKNPNFRA